jgi:ParB family transcriptional regulator, chromosome partitioning protein
VPVLIRELTDGEALEIALIENIQRTDLNPLEEARPMACCSNSSTTPSSNWPNRSARAAAIANTLRLLTCRNRCASRSNRATHRGTCPGAGRNRFARGTGRPDHQAGLSVREAEGLARDAGPARKPKAKSDKDADTKALEKAVSEAIGLKVEITHKGDAGGSVLISYKTLEQLEDICTRLQLK